MKKRGALIGIFIDGTLEDVKECTKEWLKEYPNHSEVDMLQHRPMRNSRTLVFYILKHGRFDILEYFKYRDVDNQIDLVGKHIGGKLERFTEWFDKYEKSSWNLKPLQKKQLLSAVVHRTAQIYNYDLIEHIIKEYPKTKEKYVNIFKSRTSDSGLRMYTYLNRS